MVEVRKFFKGWETVAIFPEHAVLKQGQLFRTTGPMSLKLLEHLVDAMSDHPEFIFMDKLGIEAFIDNMGDRSFFKEYTKEVWRREGTPLTLTFEGVSILESRFHETEVYKNMHTVYAIKL